MESYCDPALRHSVKDDSGSPLVAEHEVFVQQAGMALDACSEGMKATLLLHVALPVLNPLQDERGQMAEIKSKTPAAGPADASTTSTSKESCASTAAGKAAHKATCIATHEPEHAATARTGTPTPDCAGKQYYSGKCIWPTPIPASARSSSNRRHANWSFQ
jgi:hypothetical protein